MNLDTSYTVVNADSTVTFFPDNTCTAAAARRAAAQPSLRASEGPRARRSCWWHAAAAAAGRGQGFIFSESVRDAQCPWPSVAFGGRFHVFDLNFKYQHSAVLAILPDTAAGRRRRRKIAALRLS